MLNLGKYFFLIVGGEVKSGVGTIVFLSFWFVYRLIFIRRLFLFFVIWDCGFIGYMGIKEGG